MKEKSSTPIDVYQLVTNKIIAELEKGQIPWKKPWTSAGVPRNLITGKPYRGMNVLLLSLCDYAQNLFVSFNQAKELGAHVRKGEQGHPVVFWKWVEIKDEETGETLKHPFLRYYTVFNVEQCEGIPGNIIPLPEKQNDPIATCENIVENMPLRPEIKFEENSAYYSPQFDFVNMPKMKKFADSASYYSTLFHELVHSTGHTSRLNRKEVVTLNTFASYLYSIEELTAEIGACYLNSLSGTAVIPPANNVAYIKGWLEKLKDDKRFIIYASSQAQRATDFILNIKPEERKAEPKEEIPLVEAEEVKEEEPAF